MTLSHPLCSVCDIAGVTLETWLNVVKQEKEPNIQLAASHRQFGERAYWRLYVLRDQGACSQTTQHVRKPRLGQTFCFHDKEWLKCMDQQGPGFEYQPLFYCVCTPGQVTWEVSSPVKQGYPNLGVVRGLSDMMHVKCSAQYPPHRNGLFPKFTSSPLSGGTVTTVSMFQDLTRPNTLSRVPRPLCTKHHTQSKHLRKTEEWGFTWWGEIHRQEGAVFIHICIGNIMGSDEVECAQLYRKANVGKHPLKGKARISWISETLGCKNIIVLCCPFHLEFYSSTYCCNLGL